MAQARSSQLPAAAGSVLLHVAIVLFGLFVLPLLSRPIRIAQVVPVTLMTSDDMGSQRNAVEAPTPAPAATPEPTPQAPAQTAAPEPAPTPAPAPPPPPPKPAQTPAKPAPPKPAPVKPAPPQPKVQAKTPPAKPDKSLDLDALAASLNRSAGSRQSSATKGPARPATAVKAQTSNGVGDEAATGALASMAAELQRIWNPNCDVSGGGEANIKVSFRLASNGRLLGQPESSAENASDPVIRAASDRAKSAVGQAAPFQNLPPQLYGPKITVNFNARQACAQR